MSWLEELGAYVWRFLLFVGAVIISAIVGVLLLAIFPITLVANLSAYDDPRKAWNVTLEIFSLPRRRR